MPCTESSTFKSLPKLFRKLNIAVEGEAVDGGEGDGVMDGGKLSVSRVKPELVSCKRQSKHT